MTLVLFAFGFMFVARYLPPPSPQLSPEDLAARLQANLIGFRIGMVITMVGFALLVTWAMGIAARTHAPEAHLPVLTYIQLGSVAIGSLIGQGACWIFQAAAYRLDDTDPYIVRALHDLGWFTFLAPWPSFTVWCFAQAAAIFRDARPEPGLPRWTGYLAVWTGLLFIPACLIFFFKTGPMAWNGAIAFYIPVFIFFIWVVGLTVPALRSLQRQTIDRDLVTV
ncbi:hypothetical protein H7I53_23970 [Mycolicibacterium pulveris]|uniref:hypothetical protein n=1 Tax=Mycolicibacterium pulveris TaxID=36813 RepID=UPI0013D6BF3B|nr:hypothetical protein [Mycolicibacterium pulveris]MCV6983260.1 hypothetical protein [Mycolicibacterium pulveris]